MSQETNIYFIDKGNNRHGDSVQYLSDGFLTFDRSSAVKLTKEQALRMFHRTKEYTNHYTLYQLGRIYKVHGEDGEFVGGNAIEDGDKERYNVVFISSEHKEFNRVLEAYTEEGIRRKVMDELRPNHDWMYFNHKGVKIVEFRVSVIDRKSLYEGMTGNHG